MTHVALARVWPACVVCPPPSRGICAYVLFFLAWTQNGSLYYKNWASDGSGGQVVKLTPEQEAGVLVLDGYEVCL